MSSTRYADSRASTAMSHAFVCVMANGRDLQLRGLEQPSLLASDVPEPRKRGVPRRSDQLTVWDIAEHARLDNELSERLGREP